MLLVGVGLKVVLKKMRFDQERLKMSENVLCKDVIILWQVQNGDGLRKNVICLRKAQNEQKWKKWERCDQLEYVQNEEDIQKVVI